MKQVNVDKRLYLIDDAKLLASYFVVFIHCIFPGNFGIGLKAVARFAVPFFFMCSGFFLYGNTPKSILKKAFHILKLFLSTALIYLIVNIAIFLIQQDMDGFWTYLHRVISIKNLAKLVMFNVVDVIEHLWYLPALVYVYIIYYFIEKEKISDFVTAISAIVLLVLHLLIWQLAISFEITDATFYVRNFLFIGYPFITIGRLIKKHRKKLPQLNRIAVTLLFTVGSICSVLSRFAFGEKSLPFGAIVISVTLMIVCVTSKQPEKPMIANAGPHSTFIYLWHPIVMLVYFEVISAAGLENALFVGLAPIFVCIATTGGAVICLMLQRKLKSFRKKFLNKNNSY